MRIVPILLAAGILAIGPAFAQCTDCDGDGYAWPTDCNDADPLVHPVLSRPVTDGIMTAMD